MCGHQTRAYDITGERGKALQKALERTVVRMGLFLTLPPSKPTLARTLVLARTLRARS
ncbi:hypothetical protein SAMN05192564_10991 [Paraburkholderia sartisoli]|uniref:Uncharacterized protein n=1 Tax=Paraburkholderia sartisoli TaxID=83784 RepID=A0A1H4HHU6_9BURK|nr:hypothetical protein SAMN05192564_10991 [Paraburkholderia sartisoli]